MNSRLSAATAFRVSAGLGLAGVALGAFGAHALHGNLAASDMLEVWKTAVLYHLVHSVVMLVLSTRPGFRAGTWGLFALGVMCFSGSLYALALGANHWTGVVTPFGGLFFLAGYLALIWQARAWTAHEP